MLRQRLQVDLLPVRAIGIGVAAAKIFRGAFRGVLGCGEGFEAAQACQPVDQQQAAGTAPLALTPALQELALIRPLRFQGGVDQLKMSLIIRKRVRNTKVGRQKYSFHLTLC